MKLFVLIYFVISVLEICKSKSTSELLKEIRALTTPEPLSASIESDEVSIENPKTTTDSNDSPQAESDEVSIGSVEVSIENDNENPEITDPKETRPHLPNIYKPTITTKASLTSTSSTTTPTPSSTSSTTTSTTTPTPSSPSTNTTPSILSKIAQDFLQEAENNLKLLREIIDETKKELQENNSAITTTASSTSASSTTIPTPSSPSTKTNPSTLSKIVQDFLQEAKNNLKLLHEIFDKTMKEPQENNSAIGTTASSTSTSFTTTPTPPSPSTKTTPSTTIVLNAAQDYLEESKNEFQLLRETLDNTKKELEENNRVVFTDGLNKFDDINKIW